MFWFYRIIGKVKNFASGWTIAWNSPIWFNQDKTSDFRVDDGTSEVSWDWWDAVDVFYVWQGHQLEGKI